MNPLANAASTSLIEKKKYKIKKTRSDYYCKSRIKVSANLPAHFTQKNFLLYTQITKQIYAPPEDTQRKPRLNNKMFGKDCVVENALRTAGVLV